MLFQNVSQEYKRIINYILNLKYLRHAINIKFERGAKLKFAELNLIWMLFYVDFILTYICLTYSKIVNRSLEKIYDREADYHSKG